MTPGRVNQVNPSAVNPPIAMPTGPPLLNTAPPPHPTLPCPCFLCSGHAGPCPGTSCSTTSFVSLLACPLLSDDFPVDGALPPHPQPMFPSPLPCLLFSGTYHVLARCRMCLFLLSSVPPAPLECKLREGRDVCFVSAPTILGPQAAPGTKQMLNQ